MLRPIYQRALDEGVHVRLAELEGVVANGGEWVDGLLHDPPTTLITGLSSNRCEWALIAAGKKVGCATAMIVEIGPGTRFAGVDGDDYPDVMMVTNQSFAAELADRGCSRVEVVGNCHLEALARSYPCRDDLRVWLGIDPEIPLLSFFGAKDDQTMAALASLRQLLHEEVAEWALAVRPHPHMPAAGQRALAVVCAEWPRVHYAPVTGITTSELLHHSLASLTMGSTVSAESIVLGTPSAFFQLGWAYELYEQFFTNLSAIPRIRSRGDLLTFLNSGDLRGLPCDFARDVEPWDGALERSWTTIRSLARMKVS